MSSDAPATSGFHTSEDEQTLHKLGYAQEPFRAMGGFQNFAISFTIISILAGCFTTFGQAWNNGGPIVISWGWILISIPILITPVDDPPTTVVGCLCTPLDRLGEALQAFHSFEMNAEVLGCLEDHAGLAQHFEIDHRGIDAVEFRQSHFSATGLDLRAKANLRHATLQRHLAAFEADLVVAALARALALRAAAAGLALAGGGAAPDAQPRAARTGTRSDGIQSHLSFAPPSACGRPR